MLRSRYVIASSFSGSFGRLSVLYVRLGGMKRRAFLGSLVALAVVPQALLRLRPALPVLYGDGVGDDTEALQALLDGFPCWDRQLGRQTTWIDGRTLRLTRAVYLDTSRPQGPVPETRRGLCNSHLVWDDPLPAACIVAGHYS